MRNLKFLQGRVGMKGIQGSPLASVILKFQICSFHFEWFLSVSMRNVKMDSMGKEKDFKSQLQAFKRRHQGVVKTQFSLF